MNFISNIMYAVVTIGILGGLLGLFLSLLSDDRENEEKKNAEPMEKLNSIDINYKEGSYPQVHCKGGRKNAQYVFNYRGLDDCLALYSLFQGDKHCTYACLAMGSCMRVCPANAIQHDPNGTVLVDPKLCTSCGVCISVCPTGVLRHIPRTADYYVACNSSDDGPTTLNYCLVGCTGCRFCERSSVDGGFSVEHHLARINYRRKGERHHAAQDCPTKCIVKLQLGS